MKALSNKSKTILSVVLIAILVATSILGVCLHLFSRTPFIQPRYPLPIVEINTQNRKLPVDKKNYVNSSFKLYNTENDEKYAFEVKMKNNYGDSNSVGIRLRGNSTMTYIKKPYRIKFDKKQKMFGEEENKNKNWVLLADYLDPSLIKNYTALNLAQLFDGMPWNASAKHVNLYLNGEYKGVYLLCDQLEEKSGRLDI